MMRLLALALLVPAAASAQDRDVSRTVDELAQCRAVAADADRLACFDRLAARIAAARRNGELLVLDRAKVVERKRRAFGLANPRADVFGGGAEDRATEVTELDTTVQAVRSAGPGRWNLQLANGMVWQSVDSVPFPPRAGSAIKLKEALLGGYRASIGGGRSFLVKRVR